MLDPTASTEPIFFAGDPTNPNVIAPPSFSSKKLGINITKSTADYPSAIPAANTACEHCACSIEIEISPMKFDSDVTINVSQTEQTNVTNANAVEIENEIFQSADFAFVEVAEEANATLDVATDIEVKQEVIYDANVIEENCGTNANDSETDSETHLETDKAVDPPEWYECGMCEGKKFYSRCFLLRHVEYNHVGTKMVNRKFACLHCDQSFAVHRQLVNHTKTHMGFNKAKPKCHHCGKSFWGLANLNRHIDTIHKGLKPFQCNLCSKRFTQKTCLDGHMPIHTGERKFKCPECPELFKNRNEIIRHKISHLPEDQQEEGHKLRRQYQTNKMVNKVCEICGKFLSSYSNYHYHMKMHDNRKQFQCTVCDKHFRSKAVLAIHMRSHSDDRPYQCDICGKKFRQTAHLRRHKRLHTGEKPHKCRYCNKSFTDPANYREHLRIHTGERPYVCKLCNFAFGTLQPFKRHLASVHPDYDHNQRDANGEKILAYVYRSERDSEVNVVEEISINQTE